MHKLKETGDGSNTLYIPELDETYHSIHGALQEAQHVFIDNGLRFVSEQQEKQRIQVFEMGFGTGLNALLTCLYAMKHETKVSYIGLEAFPVEWSIVQKLQYETLFDEEVEDLLEAIHQCEWEQESKINEYFSLLKLHYKIEEQPSIATLDLIYYDAFGPRAQEQMWAQEHFDYLAHNTQPEGVLVTYCAQGQFKRNLKAAGWEVERLPGPPGKREMTRAFLK